jgi:hypothetical protein
LIPIRHHDLSGIRLQVNFRPTALLTNQPRFEIFFYGIAELPKRIGAPKFSIE